MSRRTRRALIVMLLLVIAAGGIYITLTWSPHEQVRIRVFPEAHKADFVGFVKHHMLVENTSSVPLHVYVLRRDGPFEHFGVPFYSMLSREDRIDFQQDRHDVIPPRSTLPTELFTKGTLSAAAPPESLLCVYASSTKALAIQFLDWCYDRSPAFLHPIIPEVRPNIQVVPCKPAP